MKHKNKRREWIIQLLFSAFKTSLDERDYQIVTGIQRYYHILTGKPEIKADLILINIAYQIGKAENKHTGGATEA